MWRNTNTYKPVKNFCSWFAITGNILMYVTL